MKLLFLALALLCTGAHGKHFWQRDKPHEEHGLWHIVENGFSMATEAIKNLNYVEIAEKFNLKEKIEAAKDNADHVEKVLEDYFKEVWKSYNEKMHETFPTFSDKVYPHLKEFDDQLEELVKKAAMEVWPVTTDLFSGLGSEFKKFWEGFSDVAEKSRDRLRAEIDSVRTKIQPYAEDVKAEYEKYKENVKANIGEKTKNMKEEVEKDLAELLEKLKPYFEDLKMPEAEEIRKVQKKLNKLVREIHAYFASFESN